MTKITFDYTIGGNKDKVYNEMISRMAIRDNIQQILNELPHYVQVVVVGKSRHPDEVLEAVKAGAKIIGENFVHHAEWIYPFIKNKVKWHFIGHLQRNKVKKVVGLFDMIESVGSIKIAEEIDKRSFQLGKVMPILVEINSGREKTKTGIFPEDAVLMIQKMATLQNVKVMGLMTIGPRFGNQEDSRKYFTQTKRLFDQLKELSIPNADMKYLSMGMSNSYQIAIEEGANIIRIGTRIFSNAT